VPCLRPLNRWENGVAFRAIVGEDFAGVGQLVGGGDEANVFRFVRDLFDVGALSLAPFAFFTGDFVRIRAAIDDARYAVAEFFSNFVEAREAALVLDGIVQQRGDDFVFAATMLNDDGGNAEQVANVGLAFALAALVQVEFRGVTERFHKTVCENRLSMVDCPWAKSFLRLNSTPWYLSFPSWPGARRNRSGGFCFAGDLALDLFSKFQGPGNLRKTSGVPPVPLTITVP